MSGELFDQLADGSWTLPTADGKASLWVTELGEGAPVVVLHGGPGLHSGYLVDAVRRSRDRARFVLFDQRGSLMSPVPVEQLDHLGVEELIADLETLRVALGEDRLRLFGHSWGAQLALLYAEAFPDRVAELILTGSAGPGELTTAEQAEAGDRQERLRTRAEVAEAIRLAGLDGDLDQLTARQRSLRYRITGLASFSISRIVNWRQVRPTHWNRRAALAIDRSLGDGHSRAASRSLAQVLRTQRIAIIQGDQDYLDPGAARWATSARERSNVTVTVLRDAGHNAWIDDPAAFDRALAAALVPR